MFLVVSGCLRIRLEGADDVELGPGQFYVVPRGVRHNPVADEAHIVLIETVTTAHAGDVTVPGTVRVDQQMGDFARLEDRTARWEPTYDVPPRTRVPIARELLTTPLAGG